MTRYQPNSRPPFTLTYTRNSLEMGPFCPTTTVARQRAKAGREKLMTTPGKSITQDPLFASSSRTS